MSIGKNRQQRICDSASIESGGIGKKFQVVHGGTQHPAFVVRFDGQPYAYLNRCAHLTLQLDYGNSEFFDTDGEFIVCANHGAMFEPRKGLCVDGPCSGASLTALRVDEREGEIVLVDDAYDLVAPQ